MTGDVAPNGRHVRYITPGTAESTALMNELEKCDAETIALIAQERLETPRPGDVMVSGGSDVRYRTEIHPTGRYTLHRETPKLSKAEKKAAKRARRR